MKKQTFKFPLKPIILAALILLAVIFTAGYIWNALRQSDYFKIKEVIVSEGSATPFSYLKARNIFSVDLAREARSILEAYPDCRRVEMVRNLPDRIIIRLVRRAPVAYIRLYKLFLVDSEGTLINTRGAMEDAILPQISGLETKIFGPKAGKRYNIRELTLALAIIKELKTNKFLKDYKIKRIDVSTLANASFFIPLIILQANKSLLEPLSPAGGIEVKIGPDNTRNKIMILAGILLQNKFDLSKIQYVDLRFKEPVIKLNERATYGTK